MQKLKNRKINIEVEEKNRAKYTQYTCINLEIG